MQGGIGTKGQAGIHAKGQVARTYDFFDQRIDRFWRTLPAIGRVTGNAGPAAFGKGFIGFLETFGGRNDPVIPVTAFLVARPVDRIKDFFTDLGGFFENRIDNVGGEILATGHLIDVVIIKQLGQDEAHIA